MPTSKPPRILLGHEIDASGADAPASLSGPGETRLPDAIADEATAAAAAVDQRLARAEPAVPFMAGHGPSDDTAPALAVTTAPETVSAPTAAAATMPRAAAVAGDLPAFGGPLLMGEAGRLWGAFAYRQMARALEGFAEGARCRTPGDVMGLHQRLVQETLQDCTSFGIDLATVPMRSMTAPATVCGPLPSAA